METSKIQVETSDPLVSDKLPNLDADERLHIFVTLVTCRVMDKCNALTHRSPEDWTKQTKHLAEQVMKGVVTAKPDVFLDAESTKKVSSAVVKELREECGGKKQVEYVLRSQDPIAESVVVGALQSHINKFCSSLKKKGTSCFKGCKNTLKKIGQTVVLVLANIIGIICMIPVAIFGLLFIY